MHTNAIVLEGPRNLSLQSIAMDAPDVGDAVVAIRHSGVSTGTEKLFWSGDMPPFPGMGYPLVPGYEAVGEVVELRGTNSLRVGDTVFVPGASCYGPVKGLFGAAASTLTTKAERLIPVDPGMGAEGALLALAATARHAMAGLRCELPELIVGHGVVGRLLARLAIAAGAKPVVWEIEPSRMHGQEGYEVLRPEDDPRRDYTCIYDATGDAKLIESLIGRLAKGGELVLCGFYPEPISFAFPLAFMKEARLRIAAEWTPDDLAATRNLIEGGLLSLSGLITHRRPAHAAKEGYETAFYDSSCLKMILDWEGDA
ncbi:chlorophyll synthesis pathway protein BchC [Pontivivens insulae]|uniref:chlorophyll synthesis pathway protein BchC n=1 Tax=Pontivivens insulae TaxID=1639689 RepID=UPI000D555AFA|nr:chlorophyll synthesis pathway protein BchC [Pontivivens insulae]